MTAVSSAPFTLLASAGVRVLKLRCGRLWEEDGVGEDGDEEVTITVVKSCCEVLVTSLEN